MKSGASKIGASALNFEPENCIMSEQIYSDIARKTGKTTQTPCTFQANYSDLARKSGSLQVRLGLVQARTANLARNPVYIQCFRTRNPVSTRNGYRVEITCDSRSHARLTCSIAVVARAQLTCGIVAVARAADLRRYRLKSPPKMSETGRSV